jgi:hypothetical protein
MIAAFRRERGWPPMAGVHDEDSVSSDSDVSSEFTESDDEEQVFDFFDPTPVDG